MTYHSEKYEKRYAQYKKERKAAHEEICPPRKPDWRLIKLRKTRNDPKNRKIAICLGCRKPNHACKCSNYKKSHYSTILTQFASMKRDINEK